MLDYRNPLWGYSSAGRASALHAEGQRFDPAYLHQKIHLKSTFDRECPKIQKILAPYKGDRALYSTLNIPDKERLIKIGEEGTVFMLDRMSHHYKADLKKQRIISDRNPDSIVQRAWEDWWSEYARNLYFNEMVYKKVVDFLIEKGAINSDVEGSPKDILQKLLVRWLGATVQVSWQQPVRITKVMSDTVRKDFVHESTGRCTSNTNPHDECSEGLCYLLKEVLRYETRDSDDIISGIKSIDVEGLPMYLDAYRMLEILSLDTEKAKKVLIRLGVECMDSEINERINETVPKIPLMPSYSHDYIRTGSPIIKTDTPEMSPILGERLRAQYEIFYASLVQEIRALHADMDRAFRDAR